MGSAEVATAAAAAAAWGSVAAATAWEVAARVVKVRAKLPLLSRTR